MVEIKLSNNYTKNPLKSHQGEKWSYSKGNGKIRNNAENR